MPWRVSRRSCKLQTMTVKKWPTSDHQPDVPTSRVRLYDRAAVRMLVALDQLKSSVTLASETVFSVQSFCRRCLCCCWPRALLSLSANSACGQEVGAQCVQPIRPTQTGVPGRSEKQGRTVRQLVRQCANSFVAQPLRKLHPLIGISPLLNFVGDTTQVHNTRPTPSRGALEGTRA